jgi:hypothetical protein
MESGGAYEWLPSACLPFKGNNNLIFYYLKLADKMQRLYQKERRHLSGGAKKTPPDSFVVSLY